MRAPERLALHDRAEDNLRYIRETMARAGSFTSVSGRGMMHAGVVGFVATLASLRYPYASQPVVWSAIWIVAAIVAAVLSSLAIRKKSLRTGESLLGGPARRFVLAFAPALVAGAILTAVLVARGLYVLLPGAWLTLYGAAVTAGGTFSARPVPVMGATFMALGAVCLLTDPTWQPYYLAGGFGLLHVGVGYRIARYHGG